MKYIGLDVHVQSSVMCMVDEAGVVIKRQTVRGGVSAVAAAVGQLAKDGGPVAVAFEASCGYGPMHAAIAPICGRVVVVHPKKVRAITSSRRKNDRNDAEMLARLLQCDMLPDVWVPSADMQAWRRLIEDRGSWVRRRTACKNRIRALLRDRGVEVPAAIRRKLWTSDGRAWLEQLTFDHPSHRVRLTLQLQELHACESAIATLTGELDRIAARDPRVKLLQTIPGVGPRTAEAFVAWVDDPARFGRIKSIGCYFGLVPSQDQSGGRNQLGRITKEGPAEVRRLLCEAAWIAVRRSPSMAARFKELCRGQSQRRRTAAVAIAHRLCRAMLSMLRSNTPWQEHHGQRASAVPTASTASAA